MAVVVPLMIAAAAGAAGVAATTATILTVAGSLVAAKSGLSSKIDRAATKAFGSDLVKVGNIAGSVFLATGAAYSFGADNFGAAAGTGIGGADAAAAAGTSPGVDQAVAGAGDAGTTAATQVPAAADLAVAASADSTLAATQQAGVIAPAARGGALTAARVEPGMYVEQGGGTVPRLAGTTTPQAPVKAPTITERLSAGWNGMSDKSQAALVQVGGQVLSGAMQGMSAAELQKEADRKREQERELDYQRFRRGSGVVFQPMTPLPTLTPQLTGQGALGVVRGTRG